MFAFGSKYEWLNEDNIYKYQIKKRWVGSCMKKVYRKVVQIADEPTSQVVLQQIRQNDRNESAERFKVNTQDGFED